MLFSVGEVGLTLSFILCDIIMVMNFHFGHNPKYLDDLRLYLYMSVLAIQGNQAQFNLFESSSTVVINALPKLFGV